MGINKPTIYKFIYSRSGSRREKGKGKGGDNMKVRTYEIIIAAMVYSPFSPVIGGSSSGIASFGS